MLKENNLILCSAHLNISKPTYVTTSLYCLYSPSFYTKEAHYMPRSLFLRPLVLHVFVKHPVVPLSE